MMISSFDLTKVLSPASLKLFQNIKKEAASLNYPLYIVGGFVRDMIMGLPSTDYDFVVEGNALHLANQLVNKHGGYLTTYQEFFTANWHPQNSSLSEHIDLISARKETYSQPAQLPSVSLSTITDDLRRRDFTINTLALELTDLKNVKLIDPFNGVEDIQTKTLRILHDRSFIDDPTRIFRLIRFEQRLGFKIDSSTHKLMEDGFAYIDLLTGKRIQHEFNLYNLEQTPSKFYNRLNKLNLFSTIYPDFDYTKRTSQAIQRINSENPISLDKMKMDLILFILLLIDHPEENIKNIAKRLMLPPSITKATIQAKQIISISWHETTASEVTFKLDHYHNNAIIAAYHFTTDSVLRDHIQNYFDQWSMIYPLVNGDDLQALNIPPGPLYKEILKQIRTEKLAGKLNTKEKEIAYVKKHYLG